LPEDKARRLNVSLNRISGAWDFDLLNDFLKKTDAAELAGFTEQELRQISADYNYEDLSKELKDLQLGEMESISWTAKFKNEEDFKKVKETLKRVRISNKLGGFKSDYANGSVMKTLAEEYDELKEPIPGSEDEGNQMQNMEDLKKLCDNYETKHPINRAKLRK
jgi:hypothetical protein